LKPPDAPTPLKPPDAPAYRKTSQRWRKSSGQLKKRRPRATTNPRRQWGLK